jgi:pimeloyl-ACP methyl ester carboxylesterase
VFRTGPIVQPLFEHHAEFDGCQTRILELEGHGLPLVLLHGYADSADTWRLVLARLAQVGQRAIAVDLPGHGAAGPLAAGAVLPQLDGFVDSVLRYAGAGRRRGGLLVGNSLGGCLALRAAGRRGGSLRGVLAAAPAGLEHNRLLILVERDPLLRSLLALPAPLPAFVLRAAVARLYVELAIASPRDLDPGVVPSFTAHHGTRERAFAAIDLARRLLPELRDALALERVQVPLLLVWGERDRLLPPRCGPRIARAVPGARLEILSGVGHCPQVEAPERFSELLNGFLAQVDPAARAA